MTPHTSSCVPTRSSSEPPAEGETLGAEAAPRATTPLVWLVLFAVNAVLISANYPRAVDYLHELRPADSPNSLTEMSYAVGATLALAITGGVCLLYYSLAAQLDRTLWPGSVLQIARFRMGHFALLAALSTTMPNVGRLLLGEFRIAEEGPVAAVVFAVCVAIPMWLSRQRLASATNRKRLVVGGLSAFLTALVIFT